MPTDLDEHGPPPETTFDLSAIVKPELILEPGIYFDLDEGLYHGSFGLSYSGIKHLRISPYNWWVRSALNPRQAEVQAEEESEAKDLGKAFDARIVCGKEYFLRHYAPDILHSDPAYKGSLRTVDDLRGHLEKMGLKKSGTKDDLIKRILEVDFTAKIWDAIEDGYRKSHPGKTFLEYGLIEKIEMAAIMIESHPELGKAFRDGAPQVSIVWDCEKTGVRCKARLDYLKTKLITDLKTFEPKGDMPIEMAIGKEIGFRKYFLQSSFYMEAVNQIPTLIKAGKVFGSPSSAFLDSLVRHPEKEFAWIFQIKGVAPTAFGFVLPKSSFLWQIGDVMCDNAKHVFRDCLNTYGELPWLDPKGFQNLDDANIPSWSLL